ncbi:MAG: hypothetical protein HYU36_15855 [Planctomycetes bacterium]|nr:hypothetical protein [Planctomycetota bacterium]
MCTRVTFGRERMLELDGKPFFALQGRHMPAGATMEDLAEAGFNCFRHLVFGTLGSTLPPPQPLPHELHGLKICAYLYNRTNLRANPTHEEELTRAVSELREHPDLLAYETYNEPAWRPDAPAAVNQSADDLATGYELVHRLDPGHPVHQGHSCSGTVEGLEAYNACADILGCNPYPILPPRMRRHIGIRPDGRALDTPDQTLSAVCDYTRKMVEVGRGRKPVWMQLQAMAWEDFFNPKQPGFEGQTRDDSAILYPTHEQMRYMAYAEVISGASGLLFSMFRVPADQRIWQDIRRLVRELRGLHDVLAGRTLKPPLQTRYRNLGYSIWRGVETLAKEHGGKRFLIAVNSGFDPAEVTWTGFDAQRTRSLSVLGEGRTVPVVNGSATDFFSPYAARVYEVVG